MLDGLRSIDGFPPVTVEVWGPAALFTRPEAKVERLTYPVMTPSAAIGVLEAIFWKPEFSWQIQAIEVLNPIKGATVRRNETEQVVTWKAALQGQRADTSASRTQRSATYLKDVRYRIHATSSFDHARTSPSRSTVTSSGAGCPRAPALASLTSERASSLHSLATRRRLRRSRQALTWASCSTR